MKTKRIPRDCKTEQNTIRNGNRKGYHHTFEHNKIPPDMETDEDANRYQDQKNSEQETTRHNVNRRERRIGYQHTIKLDRIQPNIKTEQDTTSFETFVHFGLVTKP